MHNLVQRALARIPGLRVRIVPSPPSQAPSAMPYALLLAQTRVSPFCFPLRIKPRVVVVFDVVDANRVVVASVENEADAYALKAALVAAQEAQIGQ